MKQNLARLRVSLALSLLLGAVAAVLPVPAAGAASSSGRSSPQRPAADRNGQPAASEGERKFNQNCSRCHRSPQGFPPRISATVLRHMRVRASLSEQDEQQILHFLNP